MKRSDIPKFIIKKNMQKSHKTGVYFDCLVTADVMRDVCERITGIEKYTCEFVDNNYADDFLGRGYNKGRLAILRHKDKVFFISFSDESGEGRNSGIQSVSTAFNMFLKNSYKNKELCFYFLPSSGNNATSYHVFMYRLMRTAGFRFVNTPDKLDSEILPFNSIDDLIRARKENRERNKRNAPTYVLKSNRNEYNIYGKTYGANKYDTSLICYAVSMLATTDDIITLYEYNEKHLQELPASSLEAIEKLGKINVVNINDELEREELEKNDSLRSPKFKFNLLERLGEPHCVLCGCAISEIIQAAHIWPVANIKNCPGLSVEDKLLYATDGENGLWMCQNHHKMFDSNLLLLSDDGGVVFSERLEGDDMEYAKRITTVNNLPEELITSKFRCYVGERNSVASD